MTAPETRHEETLAMLAHDEKVIRDVLDDGVLDAPEVLSSRRQLELTVYAAECVRRVAELEQVKGFTCQKCDITSEFDITAYCWKCVDALRAEVKNWEAAFHLALDAHKREADQLTHERDEFQRTNREIRAEVATLREAGAQLRGLHLPVERDRHDGGGFECASCYTSDGVPSNYPCMTIIALDHAATQGRTDA